MRENGTGANNILTVYTKIKGEKTNGNRLFLVLYGTKILIGFFSLIRKACQDRVWQKWIDIASRFHRAVSKFYYCYGYCIAGYPLIVIVLCCLFTASFAWGFAWLKVESRAEKLYIPQNSRAITDLKAAEKYFPIRARLSEVILVSKARESILSQQAFSIGLEVFRGIMNATRFESVCIKSAPSKNNRTACASLNLFEMFNYSASVIRNSAITEIINRNVNSENSVMGNGRPASLNINALLGKIQRNASGLIVRAEAMRFMLYSKYPFTDYENEKVLEWEKTFIEYMQQVKRSVEDKGFDVFYFTVRSVDDSIQKSTGGDIKFLVITFTIICSFTCFSLGKFRNTVRGHAVAGMVGILAVTFGIACSFGMVILCGVPFLSTIGVLPFLILSVGIDDIFILLDELDRVDLSLPTREIVARLLSRVGGSITMTTLTDLVAFAISTTTLFPAIRYFCIYAAVGITTSFVMIMTFFLAYLVYDVNRMKAGRLDAAPCIVSRKNANASTEEPSKDISSKIMETLAKFLMKKYVRVVVIMLSLLLVGLGIKGTLNLDSTFKLQMLGAEGSYYMKFLDAKHFYFTQPAAINLVVPGDIDLSIKQNQRSYCYISRIARKSNPYMLATEQNWVDSFVYWTKDSKYKRTGQDFMPSLFVFLSIPKYSHLRLDIRFSADKKSILGSRAIVYMDYKADSNKGKFGMMTLRKKLDKESKIKPYIASMPFMYIEQYVFVTPETIRNLIVCGITVLVIASPFILHPGVLLLISISFAALIIELLGLMAIWNVSLNSISMIILVMAIGFAVDYSAHIAHAYVLSRAETPEKRVVEALSKTGASVCMGGFSTFLGMLATAFGSSEVFRIFFKMFFGIVVLGLLHGVVILPVLVSVFCHSKMMVHSSEDTKAESNQSAKQIEVTT